jgi:hypothetical protein
MPPLHVDPKRECLFYDNNTEISSAFSFGVAHNLNVLPLVSYTSQTAKKVLKESWIRKHRQENDASKATEGCWGSIT